MTRTTRTGLKWTTSELLQLEREVDLLQLSSEEIALLHGRSPRAIDFKIMQEQIIQNDELVNKYSHSMITRSKEIFNIF
jgi:hypothetical protein